MTDAKPKAISRIKLSLEVVKVNPDAKGVEMYAPAHEYELKGEAVVAGPVDAVLDLHRQSRYEELIHLGHLELVREGSASD